MGAFDLNDEQKLFVKADKCNVLVSASAGSGKTYTMIQKLIQIILKKKVPLKNLLVLTFTEAAANEIKQKLFAELTLSLANYTDEEMIGYIKKQLDDINNAEIGTLHSVCKKIITKYFYELEESPDFALLSEKESKYLLDLSVNKVFYSRIKNGDDDFFELYDCYNPKRNDNSLKKIILTLYDYINNKPNYNEWLQNTLKSSYNSDLKNNSVCNFVIEYYKDKLHSYISRINKLIKEDNGKYANWLNQRKQFIDEFSEGKDFIQCSKILYNTNFLSKPQKSKSPDINEALLDEKMENFNESFSDLITKELKKDIKEDIDIVIEDLQKARKNLETLIAIVLDVKKVYSESKKKKNSLDFNDLEDKMLELLEMDNIKALLKSTYKYLFFDEYQDINEKQELILSGIKSDDNYYMIGDVKQSIYAFRQSLPNIFIDKFISFGKDGVKNKLINFNQNYRSDKSILEFNNLIFDTLITEKTIGIDYVNNARFLSSKPFNKSAVSMRLIETSDKGDDVDAEESEAILIGEEISELLLQKKESGENYTFKDIAIILRKRGTFVRTLCKVLQDMQIPVYAKVNNEFFETFEISLLVSILKVISNYKNDIPLAVVLKNLFNLSEEELYEIRISSKSTNFYSAVFEYSKEDSIKEKLDKFFSFISNSTFKLAHNTINEYLNEVISDFDIIVKLKSMTAGDERVGNVYDFLSLTNNSTYEYSLEKFIEYLDFISKDNSLQNIGVGGNAVEIITIHHSKGLEYPAVIFAGLGKKLTINKDTSDIIINKDFGVGLKSINNKTRTLKETIVHSVCKISNKKWEMDEEIRLLYVAMTRAKERLILIGQYNKNKVSSIKYKDIYSLSNYLEFIFKSLKDVYLNNFENKLDFVVNENEPNSFDVKITDINYIFEDDNKTEKDIIFDLKDDNLIDVLNDVYKNDVVINTTTIKNTVTNILKEESDYENLNYMPNLLNAKDRLMDMDYLKIGSAYHTLMEKMTFNESFDDLSDLLSKLVAENLIDSDMKKQIDLGQIFVAKEVVGKLIKDAKKVYKEKQFLLQENYNKLVKNSDNNTKVIVQGVIDLVVEMPDGAYLIDYKTNRVKDEKLLKEQYALQLKLYRLAFEKATNIPIKRMFLYSFYLGKLIEVE